MALLYAVLAVVGIVGVAAYDLVSGMDGCSAPRPIPLIDDPARRDIYDKILENHGPPETEEERRARSVRERQADRQERDRIRADQARRRAEPRPDLDDLSPVARELAILREEARARAEEEQAKKRLPTFGPPNMRPVTAEERTACIRLLPITGLTIWVAIFAVGIPLALVLLWGVGLALRRLAEWLRRGFDPS